MAERTVPCSHCGALHPIPDYYATMYAGRKVTRWCAECHRLFDVELPPTDITPPANDAGR